MLNFIFLHGYGDHRDLHSFPTRRSSDLRLALPWARISPSEGEPGGRPKPRKSSEVSVVMDPLRMNGRKVSVATMALDRKSTRLNSSHPSISYAVFCLKKKNKNNNTTITT